MKVISEYGKLQRKVRNECGLSIRALSEKSKVSHSYLSQVENGTRDKPSPEVIKKIAEALNYDYFYMMRIAGYMDTGLKFGGLMKSERIKRGITIEELSNKINLSTEIIEEVENDKLIPGQKPVKTYADFFNLDYTELMKIAGYFDGEGNFIDPFDGIAKHSRTFITFDVPAMKIELNQNDGVESTSVISVEEAKQNFLYLENLLTMDENIYLNKKALSPYEKEKALQILKLVFEKEKE